METPPASELNGNTTARSRLAAGEGDGVTAGPDVAPTGGLATVEETVTVTATSSTADSQLQKQPPAEQPSLSEVIIHAN